MDFENLEKLSQQPAIGRTQRISSITPHVVYEPFHAVQYACDY
jgi:hypothetical protein